MTTPVSGTITLGDVATEVAQSLPITLGDVRTRWLARKYSGSVSLTDCYNKTQARDYNVALNNAGVDWSSGVFGITLKNNGELYTRHRWLGAAGGDVYTLKDYWYYPVTAGIGASHFADITITGSSGIGVPASGIFDLSDDLLDYGLTGLSRANGLNPYIDMLIKIKRNSDSVVIGERTLRVSATST